MQRRQSGEVFQADDTSKYQGVQHVNWLLRTCGMYSGVPISHLKQCSSSLFVLLFQRIFSIKLQNIELEPDTIEKKLANIRTVLIELERILGSSLHHISPEEIVMLNEDHILMLINIFVRIVKALKQAEEEAAITGDASHSDEQPHEEGEVPDTSFEVFEESSADSAGKTQELVSRWKEDLVPPNEPNAPQALVHKTQTSLKATKLAVASLREQMSSLDRLCTQLEHGKGMPRRQAAQPRVSSGCLRSRFVTPQLAVVRRATRNAARDARIEHLRSVRFVESLNQRVANAMTEQRWLIDTSLRHELQEELTRHRKDANEIRKLAKEEDAKYRAAYSAIVDSTRNRLLSSAQVLDEQRKRDLHSQQRSRDAALAAARETLQCSLSSHNKALEAYVDSLHSWRPFVES